MEILVKIKEVGFGLRDTNHCVLWFTVETENGPSALQILPALAAIELIEKHNLREVHDLNSRMCWVESEGMRMSFVRMWGE